MRNIKMICIPRTRILSIRNLLLLALIALLGGCGGGDGASGGSGGLSPSSPPPPTGVTLSGTAAIGAPIVGGTVSLKDNMGATATTTTDLHGNYSFDVSANSFPVMLKVQPNILGAVPLFSAALTSGTANTTPLTSLQVFEAVGGTDPSEIYNSGDFSKIRDSTLNYGKITVISNLASQLASNGLNPTNINPITTPMITNGIGMDAIMDHTSVAIIGNEARFADSEGNSIPSAAPNEMTLAVDGMQAANILAFLGLPSNYILGNLNVSAK